MGAHCNFYSRIKTLAFLQLIKNISRMTLPNTGRQQNTKDAKIFCKYEQKLKIQNLEIVGLVVNMVD